MPFRVNNHFDNISQASASRASYKAAGLVVRHVAAVEFTVWLKVKLTGQSQLNLAILNSHCSMITVQHLLYPSCRDDNCHVHSAGLASTVSSSSASGARTNKMIPVIVEYCWLPRRSDASPQQHILIDVVKHSMASTRHDYDKEKTAPTLYVLNAATIMKLHAVQHLTAGLIGYDVDVAVFTETHLKKKQDSQLFVVDGYSLFRRDRTGRRGGGVAVYVSRRLQASVWNCPSDSPDYELMWVKVEVTNHLILIGALYHPLKLIYQPTELLDHLENC